MSGLSKVGRNEKCPNCPHRDKGDIFRKNGEAFACLDLITIAIDEHSNEVDEVNWEIDNLSSGDMNCGRRFSLASSLACATTPSHQMV